MTENIREGKRFYCPGCDKFIPEDGTSISGAWYCEGCKKKPKPKANAKKKAGGEKA